MSAFGYTRYGQKFGVAVNDGGTRISDKLMEATDRLAISLFELGACKGLEENYIFLYPFVGGTQASHSYNLADPSKYRILFEDDTTVTHNANGITGPGNVQLFGFEASGETLTVADCCCAYGIYNRTAIASAGADPDLQAKQDSPSVVHGIVCRKSGSGDMIFWNGVNSASGYIIVATANAQGFYATMRATTSNAMNAYKNGVNVGNLASGQAVNSSLFYLFGDNTHNLAYCYLSKSFAISGMPYTHAMNATMYSIVQKFQSWCGRQV